VTIWQTGHLNVNDTGSYTKEWVKECVDAGYTTVQTMLNPKHPDTSLDQISIQWLQGVKSVGAKNFAFVWADDFETPATLFEFCKDWREKSLANNCAITGFVINAEDEWEKQDQAGQMWSQRFLSIFRQHTSTRKLSLALNTYNGCGGIDLVAWMNKGARLYCQTFAEGKTHEWPIDGYITWAKFYGYTRSAMIKPNWGTYLPYPDRAEQIRTARVAKTVGFSAWYAEGSGEPKQLLIPLLKEAKAAGVCL